MMTLFDFAEKNSDSLKADITHYNTLYRAGQPQVSDEQYDNLLTEYRNSVSLDEYEAFAQTLTEAGGDVKHPYAVGSLKKVKFGEAQLMPWLLKYGTGKVLVQAKIDGLSYTAKYINGILNLGATRGDGYTGKDITRKLRLILPNQLPEPVTMDVRGEITLTGDDHVKLGFKNRRNGSVGLINREEAADADVACLKGFACQIRSGHFADKPVSTQLEELKRLGFTTSEYAFAEVKTAWASDKAEEYFAGWLSGVKERVNYDVDGLVLCAQNYVLEDVFYPTGMVAFKVNQDAVQTTVLGLEWNVSKNGLAKPVVLIDPVEIDGTTVSRVTGYNAQWLLDNGVGEGALVGVIKSGEIIPKIIETYEPAHVVLLEECPSCGMSLTMSGVDLVCTNEYCGAKGVKEVESFLVKLGVDGAKAATLENFGIVTMDDLLTWRPDMNYKSQTNLYAELEGKLFNRAADELFAAMLFDGFGRKMVNRLIEFYGTRFEATGAIRYMASGNAPEGFSQPEGFTSWNMSKVADSWERNLEFLGKIVADPRWKEPEVKESAAKGNALEGKSFLFTGTLSMPRKQAEGLVMDNGGTVASGVSKNLAYLVAGEAAGSKLDKAKKLGVTVLTEQEFAEMFAEGGM